MYLFVGNIFVKAIFLLRTFFSLDKVRKGGR